MHRIDAMRFDSYAHDNERPSVVLVPGLGGHPRFHEGFIEALRHTRTVHTAAHVDFFTEPCPHWGRHVDHWLDRFNRVAAGRDRPPALVGISFGAQLSLAVWRRLPAGRVSGLVLISYWPVAGWQRAALRRLGRLDGPGARAVGWLSFRWSEWSAPDRDRLLALRRELYDDEAAVRGRLFARLTSLADAPPLPARREASLIYARRELAVRYARRRFGGALPAGTALVAGTHAVSLAGSAELAGAVERLLSAGSQQIRGDRT